MKVLRLLALLVLLGACRGGGDDERLVLDGSPRHPDAEGVVTAVDRESITLDGERTYQVAEDLQSFSTYDLAASPLLHRRGQYVQVGLDGDTARWVAGIGVVVETPGGEPVVFYNGTLVRVEAGEAIFRDGTVLELAEAVAGAPGPVRAEIDPASRRVIRFVALS